MPRTVFRPEADGFAFSNSWTLDATEEAQLRAVLTGAISGALGKLNPVFGAAAALFGVSDQLAGSITQGLPRGYGLCAGMAFAARDYYVSGLLVPRGAGEDDRPDRSTPGGAALRDYLWNRQMTSLAANAPSVLAWLAVLHVIPKEWPFLGGHRWLRDRSLEHWQRLKGHIDAGDPWPIVLIGSSKDPFTAHVVLAYGYDDPGDGTGTVFLYDMNCPGREQTTRVDFRGEMLTATETCTNRAGWTELRGFFCYDYAPETPPDVGLQFGGIQKDPSRPDVYLVHGGARFHVPDPDEFNALGLSWGHVRSAAAADLAGLGTVPRDRTLLKERSRPDVYVVQGGARFRIASPDELIALGFSWSHVRVVPDGALAGIATVPRDGTLLRQRTAPEVYVIDGGRKRHITSPEAFSGSGYSWSDIRLVPDGSLAGIPDGPPVSVEPPPPPPPEAWSTRSSGELLTSDSADLIQYAIQAGAVGPGIVEFVLRLGSGITRKKVVNMPDGEGSSWDIVAEGEGAWAGNSLWAGQVRKGQALTFYKARFLGTVTEVLRLGDLEHLQPGSRVTFTWAKD